MQLPKNCTWVGHVHKLDGKILEVEFDCAAGHKGSALTKLLNICGMTGVRDGAHGVMLRELGGSNSKPHFYGDSSKIVAGEKGEMEVKKEPNERRFRVRVYLSPSSATFRSLTIWAASPWAALDSIALTGGIKDTDMLGPYHVEEYLSDGSLVTRMAKNVSAFSHAGPIDMSKAVERPSNVVHLRPDATRAANTRTESISQVIDILSNETKVVKKTYNIVPG